MRVCTCGSGELECDGKCAGAVRQQMECAEKGHLTAASIHERVWGTRPRRPLVDGYFCYRCGETVES